MRRKTGDDKRFDKTIHIKTDQETIDKLDTISEIYDCNRSEMIRRLIDIRHDKLKGVGVKNKKEMKNYIETEMEKITKLHKKIINDKLNRLLADNVEK